MPDVKSASRVMAILELVSTHPQGLTLSEICEKIGNFFFYQANHYESLLPQG